MVEKEAETNTTASLALPIELLNQIASYLGSNDVANVRLASTLFYQAYTPYLAPLLTLKLSKKLFIKSPKSSRVRPFVSTPGPLIGFVKNLHVELDYFELARLAQVERHSLIGSIQKETTRFVSLGRLTTTWITSHPMQVSWDTFRSMGDVEEGLMAAVADSTLLHYLEIGPFIFMREEHSLSLQRFVNLKSFIVNEILQKGQIQSSVFQQTNTLLSHNHALTLLALKTTLRCSEIPLQNLFPSRSTHAELSLKSLTLEGNFTWSSPNFSFTSIPHFPNLRQLTILRNQTTITVEWDGLWHLFRETDIQLHKLSTDLMVTHSLVDYLASYKGLRTLQLFRESAGDIEFDVAERIITGVLPVHAPTLERLVIHMSCIGIHPDPSSEGLSFISFWPSPSLFLHLRHFCTLSPRGLSLAYETLQSILDWLEGFPALHHSMMIMPSYWQQDIPPAVDVAEFAAIGERLEGRTGRPAIWTVFHERYAPVESGSWIAKPSEEEGKWHYARVPENFEMEWPQ